MRRGLPGVVRLAMDRDREVVVVLAGLGKFAFRNLPKGRVWDVGIAEQTQVGVAAGMAIEGKKPVVYGIDSFLVRRAYEQIWLDFFKQRMVGLFIGLHGYERLGPSHNGEGCFELMSGMMRAERPEGVVELVRVVFEWVERPELMYVEVRA